MLKMRFERTNVARLTQAEGTDGLGNGAFDAGTGPVAFLEDWGLLVLTSLL
jgi:hypothetical protein